MNIRRKVMQIANKLRSKMSGSEAMRKAWQLAKVLAGRQQTTSVTFTKKDGTITSRVITSILNHYTPKGSARKNTPYTLLKFIDVAKLQAGSPSTIISFHSHQILK